jgi:stage IV sporulation protein B
MSRFLIILAVVFFAAFALFILPVVGVLRLPHEIALTQDEYARGMHLPQSPLVSQQHTLDATVGDSGQRYIDLKLFGIIPVKRVKVDILCIDELMVGGGGVGFIAKTDGVIVLHDSTDSSLKKGDVIKGINGMPIDSVATLTEFFSKLSGEQYIEIQYTRGDILRNARTRVNADSSSPLGLWLKDETSGMGTLTYINPLNNNFAALGHKVSDFETGARIDVRGGDIYTCEFLGISKSAPNKVGEFKISLNQLKGCQGSVLSSSASGVFGCLNTNSAILDSPTKIMPVGSRYSVRPGAAKLRTSLDGKTVGEFDIEIVKTRYQRNPSTKSMIVRITDKALLEQTGGIIHGMSGSPIIQNGRLVGALTHVITSDPKKGYGIYIDFVTP